MQASKKLESAAVWSVFAANLAVILYFWWSGSSRFITGDLAQQAIAFGRLTGLLAAFSVLIQLLLIGRTVWIERLFGLDKLARIHHWIGFALAAVIVAHPLLLAVGYASRNGKTVLDQFISFQSWEDVTRASVALWLFIAVIATSAVIVWRKLKYETWYFIHLIAYLAILLAFGHQLEVGRDLQDRAFAAYWVALHLFVLLNLAYFRFGRPLLNHFRHGFRVERVTAETPDVVSVHLSGRALDRFRFEAGQFAIWRFLAKGYWSEAHPFSFSSSPDGKTLRFTAKCSGDYTKRLKDLKPGTPALLDGPHGIFTHSSAVTGKRLYIAGGIGITPIRAMLGEKPDMDSVLIYGCRTESDIALRGELEGLASRGLKLHCVLGDQPDWTGERGTIDQEKIQRLAPDFLLRDVYLCGPWPMMKTVITALDGLGFPRRQLHYEKFSL